MRNEILAVIAVSAASFAMAEDANPGVNPNIWFDGTDERVCIIDPLLQDAYEKEGCSFWYDVDDRKNDQGGSYALYPFDTSGYNGSLIAPEIEKLGYVTIWYHLADPTLTGQTDEYPYNFVKFGFDMVPGSSGTLDISSTGGLCATYTSQIDVELEVNTEKSGNTPCFAKLPQTQEPKTVDKAIKDFAQATWAADSNKLASCAEAFKEARSVMFKLDGRASATDGVLRIFEVGPKGTCKGGKTIKDEGYYANFACKSDGEGHAACRLCAGPDGCSSKLGGMNAVFCRFVLSKLHNVKEGAVWKSRKPEWPAHWNPATRRSLWSRARERSTLNFRARSSTSTGTTSRRSRTKRWSALVSAT